MLRFIIGLLFLCGITAAFAESDEMSLKAADGSIIPARIIANNQIVTENGNSLPDGLYINTDQSTLVIQNGKVLSHKPAPTANDAIPVPSTPNDMITVNPQLPAVAATPNNSTLNNSVTVNNPTTTATTQVQSKFPAIQTNTDMQINGDNHLQTLNASRATQPALKMSKPLTSPSNLMKP